MPLRASTASLNASPHYPASMDSTGVDTGGGMTEASTMGGTVREGTVLFKTCGCYVAAAARLLRTFTVILA